jgi:ABC-type sugar transport system permease subunit
VVLGDPVFLTSARNTGIFVVLSVSLEVTLGLGIALVIADRTSWLSRVNRALVLLPWAIPPIVNGLLWSFIYNSKYGYLNAVLHQLGLIRDDIQWVGDPHLALAAVVVAYVWRTTPFGVILLYAALQGIPEELHEAAQVDGATAMQRFWGVTLPLLRPVLAVLLVLRTTFAFMVFDEILAITQGGPGNATWTLAWYTYSYAFRYLNFGIGAASGFILALLVTATAVLYTRYVYQRVEY